MEQSVIPSAMQTRLLMGTVVSIRVVGSGSMTDMEHAIERAFAAIRYVEVACSRFDEDSALRELCRHPGEKMRVPDVLFEAIRVALEMSMLTDGIFDPTVGQLLEGYGFTRHYLTGETVDSHTSRDGPVSYRDITLDEEERTVLLHRPLLLDLGAVAKGMAVDLAAKELLDWDGFAIDAGGDLYLHGVDPEGESWTVGIQHPLHKNEMICWLQMTNVAICTSGNYERRSPLDPDVHHLLNPRTGGSANGLLSCTVVAPLAILADAVSTAAFVQGAPQALEFVADLGLEALCIDDALNLKMTHSLGRYMK